MAVTNEYKRFGALGGMYAAQDTIREEEKHKVDTFSTLVNASKALEELHTYRKDAGVREQKRQHDMKMYEVGTRKMVENEKTEVLQRMVQGVDAIEGQESYDAWLSTQDSTYGDAYRNRLQLTGDWKKDRMKLSVASKSATDTIAHRQQKIVQRQAEEAAYKQAQMTARTSAGATIQAANINAANQLQLQAMRGQQARDLAYVNADANVQQAERTQGLMLERLNTEADNAQRLQSERLAAARDVTELEIASREQVNQDVIAAQAALQDERIRSQLTDSGRQRAHEITMAANEAKEKASNLAKTIGVEQARLQIEQQNADARTRYMQFQETHAGRDLTLRQQNEQARLEQEVRKLTLQERALDVQEDYQSAGLQIRRDENILKGRMFAAEQEYKKDRDFYARMWEMDALTQTHAHEAAMQHDRLQAQQANAEYNGSIQRELAEIAQTGQWDRLRETFRQQQESPTTVEGLAVATMLQANANYLAEKAGRPEDKVPITPAGEAAVSMYDQTRLARAASAFVQNMPFNLASNPDLASRYMEVAMQHLRVGKSFLGDNVPPQAAFAGEWNKNAEGALSAGVTVARRIAEQPGDGAAKLRLLQEVLPQAMNEWAKSQGINEEFGDPRYGIGNMRTQAILKEILGDKQFDEVFGAKK